MTSIMVRREKVLEMIGFDRKRVCDNLWAMVEREREGLPFIYCSKDISEDINTISASRGHVIHTKLLQLVNNLGEAISCTEIHGITKAANNTLAEYVILDENEQDALNNLPCFKSINKAYNALREQLKDEYKNELDSIMAEVYL